jgi:tetratricopeptide (TPR) repeat protein
MIRHGTILQNLCWRGCLAVLVLGGVGPLVSAFDEEKVVDVPSATDPLKKLATLELKLGSLRNNKDKESSKAVEELLFTVGDLHFQKCSYLTVVRRLEEALDRFPKNPKAPRAHFQLAESYRTLALEEIKDLAIQTNWDAEKRENAKKEYSRWMGKAAKAYYDLALLLDRQGAEGDLTAEEKINVQFLAAECRFNMGKYEESLEFYEVLVDRYSARTEKLTALGGVVRCLSALRRFDLVKKRLEEIRKGLAELEGRDKEEWEQWANTADKVWKESRPDLKSEVPDKPESGDEPKKSETRLEALQHELLRTRLEKADTEKKYAETIDQLEKKLQGLEKRIRDQKKADSIAHMEKKLQELEKRIRDAKKLEEEP